MCTSKELLALMKKLSTDDVEILSDFITDADGETRVFLECSVSLKTLEKAQQQEDEFELMLQELELLAFDDDEYTSDDDFDDHAFDDESEYAEQQVACADQQFSSPVSVEDDELLQIAHELGLDLECVYSEGESSEYKEGS